MGLIKEPKGIDFIINSQPLTKKEEKLSAFIAKRKQEIAEMKKHEPGHGSAQTKAKSKRAKNAKMKHKSKQQT